MALRLSLLLALIWFSNVSFADSRSKLIDESIADIEAKHSLLEHLDDYLAQLPTYSAWAKECIATSDSNLGDVEIHIEKLGESVDDEIADDTATI